MSVIPKITCRRCGREYSGLRSRCPYCGTGPQQIRRAHTAAHVQ